MRTFRILCGVIGESVARRRSDRNGRIERPRTKLAFVKNPTNG